MSQEFFTDGFANIAVTGTIVRIDLMSMVGVDKENKPRLEVKQRLIMPLDAFLRSYSMADDIVSKLMKAGIVNKRTPAAPGPTIQASASDVTSTKKK